MSVWYLLLWLAIVALVDVGADCIEDRSIAKIGIGVILLIFACLLTYCYMIGFWEHFQGWWILWRITQW